MKTPDVCLLIDNSNTRTKFALAGRTGIGAPAVLLTAELSVASIRHLVSDWEFNRVCLCSVVPQAEKIISEALEEYSISRVTPDFAGGVDFSSYPGVQTLGADRVANSIAALRFASLPVVAVDMGTATTFDVVVQSESAPAFAGGVIAPGFKAYAECLLRATALLPRPGLIPGAPVIGRTTQEALSAGVCKGYAGMVDSLLLEIEQELGAPVHVVLTGGDAETIAPLLKKSCSIERRLTLYGIAIAAGVLS